MFFNKCLQGLSLLIILGLSVKAYSQNVGINTSGNPADASSLLDVSAADKGILIPRVALSDVANSTAPINAPATGLLVYNTNASVIGGFGAGFYYWSGTTWTKIATGNALLSNLTDGRIWIGNGSGIPTEQPMTGDVSINNTGATTIQASAVNSAKIADGSVANVDLANMNQSLLKGRASGSGTGSPQDLTAAQVRTILNVADGANNYIHPNHTGDVTSLGDGATTISNNAVTTPKIADANVTTAKIADANITTVKIADANVTTAKIADNAINSAKISNGTVANVDLANMPTMTIKGNNTGGATSPIDLTVAETRTMLGLTNAVTGTGTTDYIARWTSASTLGTGQIRDNGTNVGIGIAPHGSFKLQVAGDVLLTSGWFRTTGSTGWYNETHGGGWYMTDATWLRTYNDKGVYSGTGVIRSDGTGGFQMYNPSPTIIFGDNNDPSYFIHANSDRLYFLHGAASAAYGAWNGNRPLTLYQGNKVGINAETPTYGLTIGGGGSIFGVDNTATFMARNASSGYEAYLWPRWSDNIMYMNYGAGGMHIRDNGSNTAIFISPGGNRAVGIGGQSGGYRLHNFGDTYTDGGWYRVSGNQGYYFETHGGGWQMLDATWMRSYNSKAILATGGVAGYGNSVFGSPYGMNPRIYANYDNAGGGGIIVADDGGFADFNDGWIQFRGSTGLMIRTDHATNGIMLTMNNSTGGGGSSDKTIVSGTNAWGMVGTPSAGWWQMWAYSFNNPSRRELKRDIIPVASMASSLLLDDIDKLKPSFYKYNVETDVMELGKETKYRPNYHLGFILDETPDYLQDASFKAIDIYALSTLSLFGVQNARKEIKEIKEAVGITANKKKISDFGSVAVTKEIVYIPFNEDFSSQLTANSIPVITITGNNPEVRLAIIKKDNKGFTVQVNGNLSELQIDYIAFAQIEIANEREKEIPATLMDGLKVPMKNKQEIQAYWENQEQQAKQEESQKFEEAKVIQQERKEKMEGQQKFADPAKGAVPTYQVETKGPTSTR